MSVNEDFGEVIYFLDGMCYGIAPTGSTVCLGKEDDIREMLADESRRNGQLGVNDIINLERRGKMAEQQRQSERILLREGLLVLSEVDLCEALNLKVDTLGWLRRGKGFPFIRVTKFDRAYSIVDVLEWLKHRKAN